MAIPSFDHNHVLPPHLGNPTNPGDLSPYSCTVVELCNHFSTSTHRVQILKNYVAFRQRMTTSGISVGFQWLDGSFLENIEAAEGRHPNDLDVVTFFGGLSLTAQAAIMTSFPEFGNPTLAKVGYQIDHYPVDYTYNPDVTVEQTRYWLQLFTHNRVGVWKGILKLPLNTPAEDQLALDYLNSL